MQSLFLVIVSVVLFLGVGCTVRTPTQESSTDTIDTAQIFSNDEYSFSFEYPFDWYFSYVEGDEISPTLGDDLLFVISGDWEHSDEYFGPVGVMLYGLDTSMSFEDVQHKFIQREELDTGESLTQFYDASLFHIADDIIGRQVSYTTAIGIPGMLYYIEPVDDSYVLIVTYLEMPFKRKTELQEIIGSLTFE